MMPWTKPKPKPLTCQKHETPDGTIWAFSRALTPDEVTLLKFVHEATLDAIEAVVDDYEHDGDRDRPQTIQ